MNIYHLQNQPKLLGKILTGWTKWTKFDFKKIHSIKLWCKTIIFNHCDHFSIF